MNTPLRGITVFTPNKYREATLHLLCATRLMKQRWMTTRMHFFRKRQTSGAAQVLYKKSTKSKTKALKTIDEGRSGSALTLQKSAPP